MDKTTIDTYNRGAKAYAKKFAGIGSRTRAIEKSFKILGKKNPVVLELGCGDGRDAVEICKLTDQYTGIDLSKEMIALAKEKVPGGNFQVMNIEDYQFTDSVDIVFTFASLLHLDSEHFENILQRARKVLPAGGVFVVSVRKGEYKGPEVVTDDHGERLFYYYQESDVTRMADGYKAVSVVEEVIGKSTWMEIVLKRI